MQNIGERLEEARKRKGISIREAAEATKIRGDYLHKFESNQFDVDLPEIYIRGFLRAYAGYLKLPADKIIADYNGLGLAEAKSRSLNREIYGRMDLSVASSKDPGREPEGAAAASAPPADRKGEHDAERDQANPATFVPRGRSLYVDRGLLLKGGGLAIGAVLLIMLIVWGIAALTSDPAADRTAAGQQEAGEKRIVLIALDTVAVTLVQASDNTTLFDGTLVRGESRSFPKRGDLFLTASALESIEVEMYGRRVATDMKGRGRVRIQ